MTGSKSETTMFRSSILGRPSFHAMRWLAGAMFVFTSFLAVSAFGADSVRGTIPFPFLIGTESVPAGVYQFQIDRVSGLVAVHGSKNTKSIRVITMLAAKAHSTATDADIVFDKVGDTYTLSEIWMPGAEGVLVYATKGKHEHNILHLQPAALRNESR